MIAITDQEFYTNRTWNIPVPLLGEMGRLDDSWVNLFDQNGYRLCDLEKQYASPNRQPYVNHGHEHCLRKVWMTYSRVTTGAHLNHAFLFERKGYSSLALEQLQDMAKDNHLVYKLINYKGKWGVDFSIDYVDANGNSMEILHFEYDSYNLNEIQEVKGRVEEKVTAIDWDSAAKTVLDKKDEWIDLEFFEQSKWKTDYFGLPAERFKMNAWE